MTQLKLLIGFTMIFSALYASANYSACPPDVELFSEEKVTTNTGYIEFSKNPDIEPRAKEFTRKGCFIDMPLITKVEGFSLEQLVGRTMALEGRQTILERCRDANEAKYYRKGKILEVTGMMRDMDLVSILPVHCL